MMINIMELQSYFIIRLKDSTFKKERKTIINDDEYLWINMNKQRLKIVENKVIKEKYLEKGRIQLRIIRIPLDKIEQETEDKPKEESYNKST